MKLAQTQSHPQRVRSVTRSRGPRGALLGQGAILASLFFSGIIYVEYDLPAEPLISLACGAVVMVSLYALWSWRRVARSYFDPYFLFLLAAVLFNASLAFLYTLGIDTTGILESAFSAETTLGALYLVAIGLAGMHWGALVAVPESGLGHNGENSPDPATIRALRRTGWILFAISAAPTIFLTARAVNVVFREGYFGLYQQSTGAGIEAGPQILAGFLVPSLLCLLAGSADARSYRRFAITVALMYSGVQLILGARFGATAPLIALAWLWDRSVQPFSRRTILILALSAIFLVFPVVRATRNIALVERSSLDLSRELASSAQEYGVSAISEFGGTLKTIGYTIDLVPSTRTFDYGQQYLYSLSTIVPNVFGYIHPAVARGTPSSWLIWTVDPYTAAAGGGMGFSFIAEAYLNFGYLGTPIVLFVLGYLYVHFILWAGRPHFTARMVVLASFLSFFLVYARGDSTAWVRPLVWYSLLVYVLFLSLRSKRQDAQ